MNLYVYSDESGVLDKVHNDVFVFGGLVFLSQEEKEKAARKYSAAERVIRRSGKYETDTELKASTLRAAEKRKLYQMLHEFYKFGIIVNQKELLDSIMLDKKSKQRYLDFAFKIAVKRLLEELIKRKVIDPNEVQHLYFFADEHSTSTNGLYELRESLEEEFKRGMYSRNFTRFFPPIFPNIKSVELRFCNSSSTRLIRAADIVANRIFHEAIGGRWENPFDNQKNKLFLSVHP